MCHQQRFFGHELLLDGSTVSRNASRLGAGEGEVGDEGKGGHGRRNSEISLAAASSANAEIV